MPTTLWHYTNANSLKRIIDSKTIYATQFNYVNDPTENKLFEIISKEIASQHLLQLPKVDPKNVETVDDFKAILWMAIRNIDDFFLEPSTYIECLSENGDLLGQWRNYADNCNGFAIGLSYSWLDSLGITSSSPFSISKVVYDKKKQIQIVSKLLNDSINSLSLIFNEAPKENSIEFIDYMITIFKRIMAEFSPLLKHEGYCDEREWRIILIDGERDVRVVKNNFIEYTKIILSTKNSHPFKHIKIGPGKNPINEEHALSLFLKIVKMEEVHISKSIIPIRNQA